MANQSLERIVNFYDIRNKSKLAIKILLDWKRRNLDWNEISWFFNIIGSIQYMISRNLSLTKQFCKSRNALLQRWPIPNIQILKSWVLEKLLMAKIIQKTLLIMNGLYLMIFRVNKSLDFPIFLGSVCFYANEGSVDISIFL
jgi:hypothetical protein